MDNLNSIGNGELDDLDRKRIIKGNRWVGYTRAQEILEVLEELVVTPRTTRMPDLLIIGPSNNGKTVITDRFSKKYPLYFDNKNEEVRQKVLMVEAPPHPDEKRFYQQILRKLIVPFRSNHNAEVLLNQVINAFRSIDLKVLIIDEIHHLLAGTGTKRQVFLNALKSLSNMLSISIVAVGTKDAFHVFQSDPQMRSRFETVTLPTWKLDKEYIRFLISYEKLLPLKKKSNLYEKEIAIKILSLTDGTIGGISVILRKAAEKAIDTGEEEITLGLIESLGIRHPDEMKRMPVM